MIRLQSIILLFLATLLVACSLAPEKPVTREMLMRTKIYTTYVIEESPEEVLEALNTHGEAILATKRVIRGVEYPAHVKILATTEGLEVLDYDR